MNKTGNKKTKFLDGNNSQEEQDSDDEDPMEYLDLVKNSLWQTRRILEDIDENGSLYVQLWHIFNMFCGKLVNDPENLSVDDDSASNLSYTTRKTGAQLAADESKTLEILSIPQFIRYFKVCKDDEAFFEYTIERLSEIAQVEEYVNNGIPFAALLNELNQCDFLLGCELTDREPNSVMNAQLVMQILEKIQVIDGSERELGIYKGVNDLDEIPQDESIRGNFND